MTKNIIISILSVLSITGIVYGIYSSNDVQYAKELQKLDEQIMELQYKIDESQDQYVQCQTIMSEAHNSAETYRAEIENLNKEKARIVGLETE